MEHIYNKLIETISNISSVQSIGKTGTKELPLSNESDIDIFIFCNEVPNSELRKKYYDSTDYNLIIVQHDIESKHWGIMDFISIDNKEVCLMYFKVNQAIDEINNILSGNRLEKEDNYFYPIGRCATLREINILFDKDNFLTNLKSKLSVFPDVLYSKKIEHHLNKLSDNEDFERAVSRKDILHYHFALDIALDHFLQLLFTINFSYFPSRKRSFDYINKFLIKPNDTVNRILKTLELGGNIETISSSYKNWEEICNETKNLIRN